MFDVTLTNNSTAKLQTSDGKTVNPNGGTWKFAGGPQGQVTYIDGPFGRLGFLDIGDQHIGGDSKETWGVLIAYQGEEIVGRYEGGGRLKVVVNQYCQAELSGMDLRQVFLPAMEIADATTAVAD